MSQTDQDSIDRHSKKKENSRSNQNGINCFAVLNHSCNRSGCFHYLLVVCSSHNIKALPLTRIFHVCEAFICMALKGTAVVDYYKPLITWQMDVSDTPVGWKFLRNWN